MGCPTLSLNGQQLEAVRAPHEPVLVLAGAGTGKTRVLIERIIKLIKEDGIDHGKILVITFTNRAKEEIKSRLMARVGDNLVPGNIFTFHAFFHRLLARDASKIDDRYKNFKLLDDNDQRSIVRRLIKYNPLIRGDSDVLDLKSTLSAISHLKIKGAGDEEKVAAKVAKTLRVDADELLEIYEKYCSELKFSNYLDYDDLEVLTLRALAIEEVQKHWRSALSAILIDEFQDTSEIQMQIIKNLVDRQKGNIFCVGDPDQSIYGFRGAKPSICSEFLDYFQARCIKLETNYRSTQKILNVANALIRNNYGKNTALIKNLRSAIDSKSPNQNILCMGFQDELQEANFVWEEISRILQRDKECKLNDFVILYRTNAASKVFEMIFKSKKVNYSITNSKEFHARKEIKFVTAFLRLLYFHDDVGVSVYLHSIAEELRMGIGEKSLHNFCEFMVSRNLIFLLALDRIDECPSLSKNARAGLLEIGRWLRELFAIRDGELRFIVNRILKISGYERHVMSKNEAWRIDNVRHFSDYIASEGEEKSNKELVEEIALGPRSSGNKGDALILSTVHQAKGLEYKYVFLVKMTHEVFPYYLSRTEESAKEERRLAYVAFTRAKKALYITFSPSQIRGRTGKPIPSIFIDEIKHLSDVDYVPIFKAF